MEYAYLGMANFSQKTRFVAGSPLRLYSSSSFTHTQMHQLLFEVVLHLLHSLTDHVGNRVKYCLTGLVKAMGAVM